MLVGRPIMEWVCSAKLTHFTSVSAPRALVYPSIGCLEIALSPRPLTKCACYLRTCLVCRSRPLHSHGEMVMCPETGTTKASKTFINCESFLGVTLEFSNILPGHRISTVRKSRMKNLVAEGLSRVNCMPRLALWISDSFCQFRPNPLYKTDESLVPQGLRHYF
jgi:hypothetical protein